MFPSRIFAPAFFAPRFFERGGAESAHYVLVTIRDQIRNLDLEGIADGNVNVRKVWQREGLNVPNVQITRTRPEDMPRLDGSNVRDDVVYQILVSITDKDNNNQTVHRAKYLKWRQDIARHFRCQTLSGFREVWTVECTPVSVLEATHWRDGYFVSRLLLSVYSRESRG